MESYRLPAISKYSAKLREPSAQLSENVLAEYAD